MHIVKRRGHKEKFDERKVYGSCYEAAYSCCNYNKKHTEKICEKVTSSVKSWIKKRDIVNSDQIFNQVVKELKKYSKETAFMYKTHRDLS